MEQNSVFSREEYARKEFWDDRYAHKQINFDWYLEYPDLKYTFEELFQLPLDAKILMVGCGNSQLTEQMYRAGYTRIVNIDISEVVINQMKEQFNKKGIKCDGIQWMVADATNLKEFPNESFDVILDKGTLDALICGNLVTSNLMLAELRRVMKQDGQMIIITHGHPEGRKKVFETSLPFDQMDYQFVKLILSQKGIMINLMRANLKDKSLNEIFGNQKALKQAMLEYTLMRFRKRKVKPVKLHIIWSDLFRKNNTPPAISQLSGQQKKSSQSDTNKQIMTEKNIDQAQKESAIEQSKESSALESKQDLTASVQTKKVTYDPQKQTHCYVYRITNKPHLKIRSMLKIYENLYQEKGIEENLKLLGIDYNVHGNSCFFIKGTKEDVAVRIRAADLHPCLVAAKYLQEDRLECPNIYVQGSEVTENKETSKMLNLSYSYGDALSIVCSVKAKIEVLITFKQRAKQQSGYSVENLGLVIQFMKSVSDKQWLYRTSASKHISPGFYELLEKVAEHKKQPLDKILRDCWDSETYLSKIDNAGILTAQVNLYLPPNTDVEIAKNYLLSQLNHEDYTLMVLNSRQGYLYQEPEWLNPRLKEANRTHNDVSIVEYKYYRELPVAHRLTPKATAAQTIAHLLWCWQVEQQTDMPADKNI